MEFTRISTLRLMLDQEKKNLENLKSSNNANRNEITQAETNILRLQEQLRQMHGEVSSAYTHTHTYDNVNDGAVKFSNISILVKLISYPIKHQICSKLLYITVYALHTFI